MRDYKNVKVPRSVRRVTNRRQGKRAVAGAPRKERRPGEVRRLAQAALVLLLIAAGTALVWRGWYEVTRTNGFVIAGVDFQGVKNLSDAELRSMAALFTGRNIFRVNLEDAAQQVQTDPWVQDVRIHRSLPNRISVVLTERTPAAILVSGDGRYLMDDAGVVIARIRKGEDDRWPLPQVSIMGCRARPGDPVTAEALPDAMALIQAIIARGGWQPAGVLVRADTPRSISVVYGGKVFKFGTAPYDEKFRRLGEIVPDLEQRKIDFLSMDLRPERQVAVQVRKAKSGARQTKPGKG